MPNAWRRLRKIIIIIYYSYILNVLSHPLCVAVCRSYRHDTIHVYDYNLFAALRLRRTLREIILWHSVTANRTSSLHNTSLWNYRLEITIYQLENWQEEECRFAATLSNLKSTSVHLDRAFNHGVHWDSIHHLCMHHQFNAFTCATLSENSLREHSEGRQAAGWMAMYTRSDIIIIAALRIFLFFCGVLLLFNIYIMFYQCYRSSIYVAVC